ncbi:thiamine phosphate synthase [Pedobacter agri]|uniref:thiamine phosphate synthase n=1 Tax=Pedobacter agri TaxID=454586 RepID=UPI00292F1267|nr:thiamine phosphate synthase [Pedobacter agri]
MTYTKKKVTGGVYLVIDPSIELDVLLKKLSSAIQGGIDVLQIWNNWPNGLDKLRFIKEISDLALPYQIPILINQEWTLLKQTSDLQGVHFDRSPNDLDTIKQKIEREIIIGVTCSGSLKTVAEAHKKQLDYISFCSMFPSSSAGSCEIVMPEMVRKAREMTSLPFFISGGITPENAASLRAQIPFNGVAVISGILNAEDPGTRTKQYKQSLAIKS